MYNWPEYKRVDHKEKDHIEDFADLEINPQLSEPASALTIPDGGEKESNGEKGEDRTGKESDKSRAWLVESTKPVLH
jgi:hypothetical protein